MEKSDDDNDNVDDDGSPLHYVCATIVVIFGICWDELS